MNENKPKTCPECGNLITDITLIRCPRCNKILVKLTCSGSCTACKEKHDCADA